MCNEQRRRVALGQVRDHFSDIRIPLRFPEGLPNLAPLESIRITDSNAIIRAAADAPGEAELVVRRWSWPGPGGKPVYNFRSDGREFGNSEKGGRCLIVTDGFYEFTTPKEPRADKRKDRWLFTMSGRDWFCIAGLWRAGDWGEAFTMLTTEPGPDVTPFHHRQVAVLPGESWRSWLDGGGSARDLLGPCPAGMLEVAKAG